MERVAKISGAPAGAVVCFVALRRHVDALFDCRKHHRPVGFDPLVRPASGAGVFWVGDKVLTEFGALLTAVLFWTGPWRNPDPTVFLVLLTLGLAAFAWSLWQRRPATAMSLPAPT
jgi:hypothetical protein